MPDMTKEILFDIVNRTIYPFDDYVDIVVESDNDSRKLTFSVPRYYDDVDLSTKSISVRFVNAADQYDEYNVKDAKVQENVVIFTWLLSDKALIQSGEVEFDILFWDDTKYKWHTKPAKLKVEHGLVDTDFWATHDQSDIYEQWRIEAKENLRLTVEAKDAAELAEANAKTSETNAKASEEAALASQNAAKTSETNAKASEEAALASQNAAKTSEDNAKESETNSKASEEAALASQNAAKESETKAKASEEAALASQNAAKTSETNAKASEEAALASQNAAKLSEDNAKLSETNAATSETNAGQSEANALASENAAKTSETNAANSATLSKSWAVGGTGTRPNEDSDNAKFYAQQAQAIAKGALGYYPTPERLREEHPTSSVGYWAIIGSTNSVWVWNEAINDWSDATYLTYYYTRTETDEITSKIAPLYTATYLVDNWVDASETEQANGYMFKQVVTLTKDVVSSPDVTADSTFMTVGACESSGVLATDQALLEALGIINAGFTTSGTNNVTTLVEKKPASDISVKWAIKG